MDVIIRQPNDTEFEQVKKYVREFWLDNTDMHKEQFLVLLQNKKFTAFGRLKEHADCSELCTLGVVKEFRGKYFGQELTKALIKKAKHEVYLVTVIPDYFKKVDFVITSKYPASLKSKVNMCTTQYHVGQEYRVMKYFAQNP